MISIKHFKATNILFKQFKILSHRLHSEVRVRFAPSPTGQLHLGGLRTALYNYLFAKSKKGKFLLRIEDTDQTRLVSGATKLLIDDLLWAGINIDEGPNFGGNYGPYIQSERLHIYKENMRKLLENGSAYHCFCTERRLEMLRKEAMRTRQIPRYDNKCRHLSPQKVMQLLGKGTPSCIRFKLTSHEDPLQDLIYGPVQHNVSENEGDPVILKSDEYPTYHFANVVDDHLMGITHVFRGVEWQISTTKHLLLYKAFGWQPPQYGHLPLLVNADGTKLSKRQGDIGILHFRNKGYSPIALLNYIVSAGGGFTRDQFAKPQIYNIDELAAQFNIENVNSHPSRLNPELLDAFNRLELIRLINNESTLPILIDHVKNLIKETYPNEQNLDLNTAHIEYVLRWSSKRITFLKELTSAKLSFLWVKPSNFSTKDISTAQIEKLRDVLQSLEFSKDNLSNAIKLFAVKEELNFALLMKNLRSILSGLKEGPGVAEMMDILGKDVVVQRLENMLQNEQLQKTKAIR
ncbi:probable glutamate--tRNA ligase, mitochondrial [Teleopsis dalmanni]|uniref:probable glutamate--tRNA ligase, mitochondrial n=1 Tax=Teleopsis dalmanni TaxID=139649 RepID=UPI0018CDB5E4|nr:probable glutamate--tRNA ligase, mitochondrial [Teleopsis dalmanni]